MNINSKMFYSILQEYVYGKVHTASNHSTKIMNYKDNELLKEDFFSVEN